MAGMNGAVGFGGARIARRSIIRRYRQRGSIDFLTGGRYYHVNPNITVDADLPTTVVLLNYQQLGRFGRGWAIRTQRDSAHRRVLYRRCRRWRLSFYVATHKRGWI